MKIPLPTSHLVTLSLFASVASAGVAGLLAVPDFWSPPAELADEGEPLAPAGLPLAQPQAAPSGQRAQASSIEDPAPSEGPAVPLDAPVAEEPLPATPPADAPPETPPADPSPEVPAPWEDDDAGEWEDDDGWEDDAGFEDHEEDAEDHEDEDHEDEEDEHEEHDEPEEPDGG